MVYFGVSKSVLGLVFLEGVFYGLTGKAGNIDGSTDALVQGKLGILIPPENPAAIVEAVEKILTNRDKYIPDQHLLNEHFSYETYKRKLEKLLN